MGHLRAGRVLDAQVACQQALALDASHADALHLMGLLLLSGKQHDHAVEWIARAILQEPKPEYLVSLGSVLQAQGRLDEALQAYDKAVQLRPEAAELWRHLGNVLLELKRPAEALLAFQHVTKLDPQHWDAAFKSGVLLHEAGRLQEAIACFTRCDELKPDHVLTLYMRGRALNSLKRFAEALADNRRAHALDPGDADVCNNIGGILQLLGRDAEAIEWLDEALELRPDRLDALRNKALWLVELHRFDEAFATYDRLRALDPGNATDTWNLSLLQLLTGDFAAGWAGREARWTKVPPVAYPSFAQPKWLGAGEVAGKTILLRADEGLGDTIQFARYAPLLAQRGARVVLSVQPALCSLLSSLPGVAQCVPVSAEPPPFDLHCPVTSLPLAFGTRLDSIPAAVSYLPPPERARVQAWEERLGRHDRMRVGLAWSGNPNHMKDHSRSIPLQAIAPLLDLGADFFSLQKEVRPDDRATLLACPGLIDLTAHLADFGDTAAFASCLDLVISVDTSVAHLAGALGRPTWILLPYTPDFRWLLDRDDSPWYPTVRLFRQDERRDYASAVERMRAELNALIAARPSSPAVR
ncbi:MAG: glycosyltransferase family protein [Bradyrhizobium sp.]|nr:glycosyltransferase family protein [Bradyrhizobium sp.]